MFLRGLPKKFFCKFYFFFYYRNYTIITKSKNYTTLFPYNLSTPSTNAEIEPSMIFFTTSFKTMHPFLSTSAPLTRSSSNTLTSLIFTITSTPPLQPSVKPPTLGSPEGCSEAGLSSSCQVRTNV